MPIETITPSLDDEPNPFHRWPGRVEQPNRIEPLAKPHFDVPFRLVEGERIFTIGSCFARHIENSLADRGFTVPIQQLLKNDLFLFDVSGDFLNNYGAPSIAQELAWALDENCPFDPACGVAELLPGGFIDMHLPGRARPTSYETVLERRAAIRSVMRQITDCRVIIITLGLAEVWYDKIGGIYLNTMPRQPLQQREPDRYELRVLTFDETMKHLRRALDLIRAHCRSDAQVLLTVSPVPMTMTFRAMDVAVANAYSKSVLRTAVEHVVVEYDNVHYFPSYESVILSERNLAWEADMIHVTKQLVDLNVGRMVSAFADEISLDDLDDAELLAEAERRAGGDERHKWSLISEHVRRSADETFAAEYFRLAMKFSHFDQAQQALDLAPFEGSRRGLDQADILIRQGNLKKALALLRKMPFRGVAPELLKSDGRRYWRLTVNCYARLGQVEAAENAARRWSRIPPKRGGYQVPLELARAHRRTSNLVAAVHYFERTVALQASDAVLLEYAEALLLSERPDDARKVLETMACTSRGAHMRRDELTAFLPPTENRIQ